MTDYLIKQETLTGIAAQSKALAGKTENVTTSEIISDLTSANAEVDSQKDLIEQIVTVLQDKASADIELPELDNPGSASDLVEGKELIGPDGNKVTGEVPVASALAFDDEAPTLEYWYNERSSSSGVEVKTPPSSRRYMLEQGGTVVTSIAGDALGDAKPEDVAQGVTFTSENGLKIDGELEKADSLNLDTPTVTQEGEYLRIDAKASDVQGEPFEKVIVTPNTDVAAWITMNDEVFGNARAEDVAKGVFFTSNKGLRIEGTALIPGGSFVYPDGAFAPVTSFTDGKQYALVAVIDGVRRYINTTTYNDYTMNATTIGIAEDAGDYVIFDSTPALFTAVASGDGFLLQNGTNYLYGTSSGGTSLRVGTTQMVWTVDSSSTGGFSDGKYYAKEDANAVWLMNSSGGYNWSVKYETAGSFGYDRDGRDNTYSTGFVSFILYEYAAGEGEVSPIVDTSDATATAADIVQDATAYVNGEKITGSMTRFNNVLISDASKITVPGAATAISIDIAQTNRRYIDPAGANVILAFNQFGDATAADVATGKTFTSAAGLLVKGTRAEAEDVTAETNAYTTKLASLESAVSALESELEGKTAGSSGGSVEIKTFTCSADQQSLGYAYVRTINPFIEGMTWEEFVLSPLNFYRYNDTMLDNRYNVSEGYIALVNSGGDTIHVSVDNTASGRVLPSDKIIAMEYGSYIPNPSIWP